MMPVIAVHDEFVSLKALAPLVLGMCLSGCGATPFLPTPQGANATDAAGIVGEISVAFLNRFSTSSVSPQACLVDFTSACRGTAEELSDITYNRSHFEIIGARLGIPTVVVSGGGTTASVAIACSFDSRTIKCDTADCTLGAAGSVGGTCTLTSVREPSGWRLCTSNFSGVIISPPARFFFGARPE